MRRSQAPPVGRTLRGAGRLVGRRGRLRFKDGKQEQVKCRATYFVGARATI